MNEKEQSLSKSEKKPLVLFKKGKDGIEYFEPPKGSNILYGAAHNKGGTPSKSAEPRYSLGRLGNR